MLRYLAAFMVCIRGLVASELSLEEKVGRLFVVPVSPNLGEEHLSEVEELVERLHIRGIITKATTLEGQKTVVERFKKTGRGMWIAVDAEWGLAMRMPECMALPRNLTLGAISNPGLLEEVGQEIARQVDLAGADLMLGPVVDLNTNPNNPIIGMRSLGDNPSQVTLQAGALLKGMRAGRAVPTLKHYPGHGDVGEDSHMHLPVSQQDLASLKASHLIPFIESVKKAPGVAVMSAHILYPNVDRRIATFSPLLIERILRKEAGFEGLIVTDALNMKALTEHFSPEEIALNAFLAGHDLLLYGDHIAPNIQAILREQIPAAYEAILGAVRSGRISEKRLDESITRIDRLSEKRNGGVQFAASAINTEALKRVIQSCYCKAMTRVGSMPAFDRDSTLFVHVGEGNMDVGGIRFVGVAELKGRDLSGYASVVGGVFAGSHSMWNHYGVAKEAIKAFNALEHANKAAVVLGSPYLLREMGNIPAMVLYENNPITQSLFAEQIGQQGELPGSMPVEI